MNRKVPMKQLISLLLIILITIISWSSYAKNTEIRVHSIYIESSYVMNSTVLKPTLSNQQINEYFGFTPRKTINKHKTFFELAIVFNEKLQQFIAFFTDLNIEFEDTDSSDYSSANTSLSNISSANNSQSTIKKCKESS